MPRTVLIEVVRASWAATRPNLPPESGMSHGSGFSVTCGGGEGILTCAHVVAGARDIRVWVPGTGKSDKHPGRIVWMCMDFDLALLDVPALPSGGAFPIANPYTIRADDDRMAWAVGFPLNRELKRTQGTVSGWTGDGHIQTTTPINPGNSGGPLCVKGPAGEFRVIGVNSSGIMSASNVGYAVPIPRFLLCEDWFRSRPVPPELSDGDRPAVLRVPLLGICTHRGPGGAGVKVHFVLRNSPVSDLINPGDLLTHLRVAGQWLLVSQDGEVDPVPIYRQGSAAELWVPHGRKLDWATYLSQVPFGHRIGVRWVRRYRRADGTRVERVHERTDVMRGDCATGALRLFAHPQEGVPEYADFAGMLVQPLTRNLRAVSDARIRRHFDDTPAEREKEKLVCTYVEPGSEAYDARSVDVGAVVESVTGDSGTPTPVRTVAEFRAAVRAAGERVVVTFRSGRSFEVDRDPGGSRARISARHSARPARDARRRTRRSDAPRARSGGCACALM